MVQPRMRSAGGVAGEVPRRVLLVAGVLAATSAFAFSSQEGAEEGAAMAPDGPPTAEQLERGRRAVLSRACGACHGGGNDPSAEGWLAGSTGPGDEFQIGACSFADPDAQPCFVTRARNLTPDNDTGLGRFTERQIFNALRFGLRPGETPDVEITSTVPGEGNFPENPKYLAPPMPWPSWRHMTDQEIWDIAAYLKHAVRPVVNRVEDSEGPPDFWASGYTVEEIGPWPAAEFPTEREVEPAG
jgi:mono/diheme cytochrome c family protein